MMGKPRVLMYGHDPRTMTGFSRVVENVACHLTEHLDIDFACQNYSALWDTREEFEGCNFINVEEHGSEYGVKFLSEYLKRNPHYDILWLLQDPYLFSGYVEQKRVIHILNNTVTKTDTELCMYIPFDTRPRKDWIYPILKTTNNVVCCTNWAFEEIKDVLSSNGLGESYAEGVKVIPHGVNTDMFYEMNPAKTKSFRQNMLGDDPGFVIGYVGDNSKRKRIPRDIMIPFARFYQDNPDSTLLLVCDPVDYEHGWNLNKVKGDLETKYDLDEDSIQFARSSDNYLTDDQLRKVYNAMDLFYLPSQEGWGLTATEAMACGTLTALGDHSALSEQGEQAGSLMIDVEKDDYVPQDELSRMRSAVNLEDVVNTFYRAKNGLNDEQRKVKRINAKQFADSLDWRNLATEWNKYLTRLYYG